MENVVSARRLRKSMINTSSSYDYSDYKSKESKKSKLTYQVKFLIRCLISSIILFLTIFCVNNYGENLSKNSVINRMYQHYKFNFSIDKILNNFEEQVKSINSVMGDIIPKNIKLYVVSKYNNNLKPFILDFNINNLFTQNGNNEVEIYLYNQDSLESTDNNAQIKEISSSSKIELKDIPKVLPAAGTITSRFGEREKIFDELSTNHTGIDIANTLGTDIISSTSGKVVKIKEDDKYYGNYIEIDTYGYIFKYAHLEKILVSQDEEVEIGSIIAKMGNTGMSTGPHLHFEIIVDGNAVDPESVMNFE